MSKAVELLERDPRVFWGNVIKVLLERGWKPPRPDDRAVDDLLAGMELVAVPNDIRDMREVAGLRGFTPGEVKVLVLLVQGMENSEIADELGLTHQTVKFHLTNIYRKLGVKNRTAAVTALLAFANEDAA